MSPHKPRLLDLFCGAGGAAMGYHQAGFTEIVCQAASRHAHLRRRVFPTITTEGE